MNKLIIITLLGLVGCSHQIVVKTPASKFLSAESQGKPLKGNVNIFVSQGTEAQADLRNGQTDNELVLARDEVRFFDILVNGELGVWGPIDLIHISGGRLGSHISGAKVQLFGDRRLEAKQYNFSVSVLGGYGSIVNNVQEGDDFELTPQDDDTTAELNVTNSTAGLLIGYRAQSDILVNLGYYKSRHNFSGTLESQNAGLDGKNINYIGSTSTTTLGVFSYTERVTIGLEIASENIKWDRTDPTHVVHTNLSVGFHW